MEKENAEIVAVLTTHKHWDHAGGNNELRKRLRGLVVYGGDIDRPPGCNRQVLLILRLETCFIVCLI